MVKSLNGPPAIETFFFAYRAFTAGPDRILGEPRPDGMGDFEGRRAGGNRALGAVGESQYDGHGILWRLRSVGGVEDLVGALGQFPKPLGVQQRRLQGGRQQGLQVAVRDFGFGVLGRNHLALFGDAQGALHRPRRLGQDGVVAGTAAAAARRSSATAAVVWP